MRARRLLRAEEKAHALPVKLVLPLALFVFPVMMVVVMLPVLSESTTRFSRREDASDGGKKNERLAQSFGAAALLRCSALLAGCSGLPPEYQGRSAGDLPTYGALPSESPTDKGKRYYRDGDYGLAEKSFRKAVEEDHNNAEAWLGLAASYDRLRRFDLADRAYDVVVKLVGYTPTVLNNLGYHQLLLGNREAAEKNLVAAHNGDPKNPFITNNLLLVDDPDHAPDPWEGVVVQR